MTEQSSQNNKGTTGHLSVLALILAVSGLYGCGEAEKAPVETPVKPAEQTLQPNSVTPDNN